MLKGKPAREYGKFIQGGHPSTRTTGTYMCAHEKDVFIRTRSNGSWNGSSKVCRSIVRKFLGINLAVGEIVKLIPSQEFEGVGCGHTRVPAADAATED